MDKLLTDMNNVFVRFPEIGDVVVKDIETKTPQYIKLSSFVKTELDESVYEIIGAVAWREHDKVLVVYKENTSTQLMNRPWWYLSGYTLDGTDRTGTLSIRVADDGWNANVDKVIPYNAMSAEGLVEQLNNFFEGDADCNVQDWYANIEEDGRVYVSGVDAEKCEGAVSVVKLIATDPEVGAFYNGVVTRLMSFGAFVEIAPGKEGLVHISRLDVKRTEKVEDVVNVGDSVIVKCIEIDDQGRINLSRRDALIELEGMTPENEIDETPRKPRRDNHNRRGDRR